MTDEMFWAYKTTMPVSRITVLFLKNDLETNVQEPTSQLTFQQDQIETYEPNI